jgi:hypothetical protein
MSMDTPKAQAIVVTVGLGVVGLAVLDAARTGQRPTARRLIGTGFATFALSAGAQVVPPLAGSLALLWGVSALIVSGGPVLSSIARTTSPTAASRTSRPTYSGLV